MAMVQTKLHASVQLGNSVATHYTVPASTTTIVKQLVLCNTTASNATVDVHLVPSGGTAGVSNALVYNLTVDALSTMFVNVAAVMATSDFISAKANVAATVTMHSFGIEES
jgi:hypothetical protein